MTQEHEYLKDLVLGKGIVVAIDGPSGVGKSTAARLLAAEMAADFLDTGSMYRAVAWYALDQSAELDSPEQIVELAKSMKISVNVLTHSPGVSVDGVDISAKIRQASVSVAASKIAAYSGVRTHLVSLQRQLVSKSCTSGKGIVLEGRATTTVVSPDADIKILLTASTEARLQRRGKQLPGVTAQDLEAEVVQRDNADLEVNEFMSPAPGVVAIDTTDISAQQVANKIGDLIRQYINPL